MVTSGSQNRRGLLSRSRAIADAVSPLLSLQSRASNASLRTELGGPVLGFALLVLVVVATWKTGTPFFWRDDWYFLRELRHPTIRFVLDLHAGHFVPAFKATYLMLLSLFGVNVQFLHYASLGVLAATAWHFWGVSRAVLQTERSGLLLAVVFAVHPVNFVAVLWPFQIGLLLHLLFQAWAVHKVLRDTVVSFRLLLLLLLVQQLAFGNGHFIPLTVASGLVLLRGRDSATRRRVVSLVFVTVGFVLGQYILLVRTDDASAALMLSQGAVYVAHLTGFMLTNIARAGLLFDRVVGELVAQAAATVVLALGVWLSRLDPGFARRFAFSILWLLAASVNVSLARPQCSSVIYYYTSLALMPALLTVALVVTELMRRIGRLAPSWMHRCGFVGVVSLLLMLWLLDQQLVGIFETRNQRNREALITSLRTGAPFAPFDDPVVAGLGLRVSPEDATSSYRHWQRHALLADRNRY